MANRRSFEYVASGSKPSLRGRTHCSRAALKDVSRLKSGGVFDGSTAKKTVKPRLHDMPPPPAPRPSPSRFDSLAYSKSDYIRRSASTPPPSSCQHLSDTISEAGGDFEFQKLESKTQPDFLCSYTPIKFRMPNELKDECGFMAMVRGDGCNFMVHKECLVQTTSKLDSANELKQHMRRALDSTLNSFMKTLETICNFEKLPLDLEHMQTKLKGKHARKLDEIHAIIDAFAHEDHWVSSKIQSLVLLKELERSKDNQIKEIEQKLAEKEKATEKLIEEMDRVHDKQLEDLQKTVLEMTKNRENQVFEAQCKLTDILESKDDEMQKMERQLKVLQCEVEAKDRQLQKLNRQLKDMESIEEEQRKERERVMKENEKRIEETMAYYEKEIGALRKAVDEELLEKDQLIDEQKEKLDMYRKEYSEVPTQQATAKDIQNGKKSNANELAASKHESVDPGVTAEAQTCLHQAKQLAQFKKENNALKLQILKMQKVCSVGKRQLQEVQTQMRALKADAQKIEQRRTSIEQLQSECAKLHKSEAVRSREINELKTKLAQAYQRIQVLDEESRAAQDLVEVHEAIKKTQEVDLNAKCQRLKEMEWQRFDHGCTVTVLTAELQCKASELKEMSSKLKSEKVKILQLEHAIKLQSENIERGESINAQKEKMLGHMRDEISRLRQAIEYCSCSKAQRGYFYQ